MIDTDFHRLYVHAPLTLFIHVHVFSVNPYVFLVNHILYVLFPVNVGAVLLMLAVVVLGAPVLTHANASQLLLGFVYIFANVKLVQLGAIYVFKLFCA